MNRRKLSKTERQKIYNKCQGHCAYCGCDLEYKDMQVDHVHPISRGGSDALDNMLPACRSCNHYKSSLSLDSFRRCIKKWPDVLMRDSVTYRNAVRFGMVVPNRKSIKFYFEIKSDTNLYTPDVLCGFLDKPCPMEQDGIKCSECRLVKIYDEFSDLSDDRTTYDKDEEESGDVE